MENYRVVYSNTDTLVINAHGRMPAERAEELEALKRLAQEAEEDVATPWTFASQTLFVKPHGSQRQWRWILHCPALHLDLGAGTRNHIVCKARLSALLLAERGSGDALYALHAFLVELLGGEGFTLQVSEVHLCADIAGWALTADQDRAFITRGHKRSRHVLGEAVDLPDDQDHQDQDGGDEDGLEVRLYGRRCTGYEFSRGAPHACRLYDKTNEIRHSRKDWMRDIWTANGWDGEARVTRVEFVYKRACLKEMGIECPYELLDRLAGLWGYSTAMWLRHTVPCTDPNRTRWACSPFWRAVQAATFDGDPMPLEREQKVRGDLTLICQMLAGCASTAAAYLADVLPDTDDGSVFLRWFYTWMGDYLDGQGLDFARVCQRKRLRLGVVGPGEVAA